MTQEIKMTFTFILEFNEEIETNKQAKEEIIATKEYITNHVHKLDGHHCYATKINIENVIS